MPDAASVRTPIARAREAAGITQQTLAYEIGVATKTISMWETGKRIPRAQVVADAAERLGVSTDFLLDLTDDPTPARKATTRPVSGERPLDALGQQQDPPDESAAQQRS